MHEQQSSLPVDILKTVAYFDIFDYPVTSGQIFYFLTRNSVTAEDVVRSAEQLVSDGRLVKRDDYFLLTSNDPKIVRQRRDGEEKARRLLTAARFIARMLKRVPFIRGVFITGSLSKAVADSDSDIDFMIVTVPERVWIVRSMLTLFRKTFLFGSSKYFCTNYYVTERAFPLELRNLYTAVEVVTTKAVWNATAFEQYQMCNRWTKDFLPNNTPSADPELLITPSRSWLQRVAELFLHLLPLRSIDRRLMEYHRTHWTKAFGHIPDDRRETMFMITPDVSACWPDDRQQPVLSRYREKLAALGLH
jgi:hypothetical protein